MIDIAPLAQVGLLLGRPGMLVVATPVLGGTFAPPSVKVGLTLILAILLYPVVTVPALDSPGALAVVLARESAIGFALAMSVRLLVAAAELAGYLAGFQVGFAVAEVIDPLSGVRNNLLALLYGSLTAFVFLAIDGHHLLLRALVASYGALPIGFGYPSASLPETVARMLGIVFLLGVQLAAPIMVVALLVELSMGLFTRAAPALNLMVIGFPLRLLAGLLALGLAIQVVPGVVSRFVEPVFEQATQAALAFR